MRASRYLNAMILAVLLLAIPAVSFAGVFVNITIGPPALPVYAQPICPGPGYIWAPGYWAYGPDGYFWVPGTWVVAPQPGLLWTPGYWAYGPTGFFLWHGGYWGPHVGFYGGVPYGYGYTGVGYQGGYWRGNNFYYNRTVNNVNVTNVTNVYNTTVINNNTNVNRVSYNGGPGGLTTRPTSQELVAEREQHVQPTTLQTQHEQTAQSNRQLLASVNHGSPAIAATARPAEFSRGVVAAKQAGAPYNPTPARGASPQANSIPRPNNNSLGATSNEVRPETASNNAAPRPNVPRPPSANSGTNLGGERPVSPRPESNNAERPGSIPRPPTGSQPRAETYGNPNAPRSNTTLQNTSHGANYPHASAPSQTSRPAQPSATHATAPHPQAPQTESHPAEHEPERNR